MPEMPDNELRNAIDAICARLQSDLQSQMSALEAKQAEVREQVRREAESKATHEWSARLEQAQTDWHQRLQSELAAAAAEADRRLAAETERARAEADKAAAESAERARNEAAESAERARKEAAESAEQSAARIRAEAEQSTARIRQEMEEALSAERQRLAGELDAERARALKELAGERDRTSVELETERLRVKTLTAALEEAQTSLRNQDALTEARTAERQSQLAFVERLSGAVRTIALARSLSDTLTALVSTASSVAPRVALFIVNGPDLQGWRAEGFAANSPASLRLAPGDSPLLSNAVTTGSPASTPAAPPPAFAALPADRAALAVPIIVGGHTVAVLYADDGSALRSETSAAWSDAIHILGAHASACVAYITALRTTQAMRATAPGAAPRAAAPGTEEDSSARRYARLLVSEIKLYNEAAVRTGREKRDLLSRLRPEIERARRLYEERVSPSIAARGAYFQQELVHTLADGDQALLGETV
jgi:hypothetical protein